MNYSLINLKSVGVILTATSALLLTATPSKAVVTSFSTSDFMTNSGTVVAGANSSQNIDNVGFGNVFADAGNTDGYLLLGAADPNGTISGPPNRGSHTAQSNTTFEIFSLTDNVSLKFDWAFAGVNTGTSADDFQVGIIDASDDFSSFFQLAAPDFGSQTNQSAVMSGFTPGTYTVGVSLTENLGGYNTAVGFDNITSSVPFEFSPAQGLLAIGGFWGVSAFIKRRKANTSNLDLT